MKSDFASKKFASYILTLGLMGIAGRGQAADLSLPVTGNLLGSVLDPAGAPQLGANVQLFNKYDRLLATTLTAPDGRFAFASLPADAYSVRVLVASFLPVSRDNIPVKAGRDSVLQIHLATLFSSIEVKYVVPSASMTDDWKWVLRSSPATRPINRFLPDDLAQSATGQMLRPRIFSGTHAMLSLSGGDGGLIDSDSAHSDVGTGFALSTNVRGKNLLQVGGSLGQTANFGATEMGLCAIYSPYQDGSFGNAPEVTLTISQLGTLGAAFNSGQAMAPGESVPVLRTVALGMYEVADPTDNIHIEYGATGESIDYLQHTGRVSPFARVTADLGSAGELKLAYSDGGRPDALTIHQRDHSTESDLENRDDGLNTTVAALARLPQLSERNGRLELQRTQNFEIGFNKRAGSRTYSVSAFHENVWNGRLNVAGDLSDLAANDLLSDGVSRTSTYNIGNYQRNGYLASVDQHVSNSIDLLVAYGRMGGFSTNGAGLSESSGTQERFLNQTTNNAAAVDLNVRTPVSGTRISAGYGWMDSGTVVPRHIFTTQNVYLAPGLNVVIRQPLPSLGLPGHLELTADVRNLLSQGYIPMNGGAGHTMLIMQVPRSIRGGLNFIF